MKIEGLEIWRYIFLIFILQICKNDSIAQESPGAIYQNPIKIELTENDQMGGFQDGLAVIKKGKAYGVIDKSATFVVPFNKYSFISDFTNGYAMAKKGNDFILIDQVGTEVNIFGLPPTGPVSKDGYVQVQEEFGILTMINITTRKKFSNSFIIKNQVNTWLYAAVANLNINNFNNGFAAIQNYQTKKYGYINRNFKVVIQPQYEYAGPFSEGLALVQKQNEFGEGKYGYIDTSGRVVIPFIYTTRPGDFYNNRAYIEPRDKSEFFFGYIDKKGDIKIRLIGYPIVKDFKEGYILYFHKNESGIYYSIDTAGSEKLVPTKGVFRGTTYNFQPEGIIYKNQIKVSTGGSGLSGIIDIQGPILAPPIYLMPMSYFDPISNLAYAKFKKSDGKYIEGYINREGVFVVIKVQTSNF